MWKKALTYILLLFFINTALLPGENEDDTPFNDIEEVEEEYNSIVELILEVFLEMPDDTPEDEDDDNPDWVKKTNDFYYCQIIDISIEHFLLIEDPKSPLILRPYSSFLEHSSPPPKQA
ncbi:hypothetical protein MYP_437 [Sporocytophaga myxococcoides]|uniref:Uncharacterized protein n=1 Tax=Sporocytophaga myxococcoides TaxID=153721 RepID=A0A098L8P3_9BACT|nr:hypothetical protein [Sporocytophaga myxococcoides]GAL83211.1 hypothetical protein MYP_437 [Sporocytophaga myxococcoides]